jgi:hypothetical protein
MLLEAPRHPAFSRLHILAKLLGVCFARSGSELLRLHRTGLQEDERSQYEKTKPQTRHAILE